MTEGITLSNLNKRIKEATEQSFPSSIWIVAEILELNINRSGHCYMELIEKSADSEQIIARSRATIWSFKYRIIRPYFESTTGTKLEPGIKVLVKTDVSFHEIYGLSLNISDIEPSFTMGEMAMHKREVIAKLTEAGVLEMNRDLSMSPVPQDIAVISSETAAGFGDFMDSLQHNNFGFAFHVTLFPAIVQGDAAEGSIIGAFEQVFESEKEFDAVVLIRGGGSQADLNCFNGFDLAMNIAQFPLPVLTGIGHERDETIADMVAHKHLKTPTAVAEFLVDRLLVFAEYLADIQEKLNHLLQKTLYQERLMLQKISSELHFHVSRYISNEQHRLENYIKALHIGSFRILEGEQKHLTDLNSALGYRWKILHTEKHRTLESLAEKKHRVLRDSFRKESERLKFAERTLEFLHPERVLKRGYSITWLDGKVVKSGSQVERGNEIRTKLASGEITSKVLKIKDK